MKEKLIEILGLKADATDQQILDSVELLKMEADAKAETNGREKKIRAKIAESGGALSREQASMAIEHQEEANTKRKAKK
jgi:hypothetical protein